MRILDDTRRRKRNRKLRNAKYVELASIGRSIDENATNKTGNQSLRKVKTFEQLYFVFPPVLRF